VAVREADEAATKSPEQERPTKVEAIVPGDAGTAEVAADPPADGGAATPTAAIDAGAEVVQAALPDAAAPTPVTPPDAAPPVVSNDPGGDAVIESVPPGARVFVDGSDMGTTPVSLPASTDRHSIALFLPGHDLYTAEIDGRGTHRATMVEVTPPDGPAGIKVRCKTKDRYYVFVDGKPTGQLCPTERIGVGLGSHTVEVYDFVTEDRKEHPARVKETRNSLRVRVD
jgi:hypothetical protein